MAEVAPIETLFSELGSFTEDDYRRIGSDRPILMIAMTARTGSTHLCSALSSVLPLGNAGELLNARDFLVGERKRRSVASYEELLNQHYSEGKEIILFKAAWIDFKFFGEKIFLMFPNIKIVYLDRFDVEAQAVSLFKAIVTGNWHKSPYMRNLSRLNQQQIAAAFDLPRICRIIDSLNNDKMAWEEFFFKHKISPLRVYYEFFANDIRNVIGVIADYIDQHDVNLDHLKSIFTISSDQVNAEWRRELRNYRSGSFFKACSRPDAPKG